MVLSVLLLLCIVTFNYQLSIAVFCGSIIVIFQLCNLYITAVVKQYWVGILQWY